MAFRIAGSVLALVLPLLAGCGQAGKEVYPVTGEVLYKGKQPCAGALVVFHPKGATGVAVDRPNAVVREDGTFTLSTFADHDGAPPGEYGVTVVWQKSRVTASKVGGDLAGRLKTPDVLKGRYGDPRSPRLKATVEKRATTVPRFTVE